MLLTPCYGRDYRSAKDAKASFLSGEDWTVADVMSKWCGKPASARDFRGQNVTLRFGKLRKVTTVDVPTWQRS